jgi:hypothetical protein
MLRSCLLAMIIFTQHLLAQPFGINSKLEVGLGYIPQRQNSMGILRLTIALNDLETKNNDFGLGIYCTPEYRSENLFNPEQPYYFRMPIGITKKFNNFLGVFAGMDFIYWIKSDFQFRRSEIGATFLLNNSLNLRLGFSKYVGPSVGLGYQVKLVKTPKKKD